MNELNKNSGARFTIDDFKKFWQHFEHYARGRRMAGVRSHRSFNCGAGDDPCHPGISFQTRTSNLTYLGFDGP